MSPLRQQAQAAFKADPFKYITSHCDSGNSPQVTLSALKLLFGTAQMWISISTN